MIKDLDLVLYSREVLRFLIPLLESLVRRVTAMTTRGTAKATTAKVMTGRITARATTRPPFLTKISCIAEWQITCRRHRER